VHQRVGPVVDVEQDRVEPPASSDHRRDIAHDQLDPAIAERTPAVRAVLALVPAHDGGHQLGDHDLRVGRQRVERRAQRVPEAEPADQHAGSADAGEPGGDDAAELVLGAVFVRRHQRPTADRDRDVRVPAGEHHLLAIGQRHALEDDVIVHAASIPCHGRTLRADSSRSRPTSPCGAR